VDLGGKKEENMNQIVFYVGCFALGWALGLVLMAIIRFLRK
jgi:hypothetical protein